MRLSRIRIFMALVWVVLVADLMASVQVKPVPPTTRATAAAQTRPAKKLVDDVTKAHAPRKHARPAPPVKAISYEPLGPARPVAPSAPPPSYIRSTFPAQYHAALNNTPGSNAWALLVGINRYSAPTHDNIGSYQDAVTLRSYLIGLGWHSDHILLLGDEQATRGHLVAALKWLASKTNKDSLVVFHYSGHEKPYTTTSDGDSEARDVALWLSDNSVLIDGELGSLLNPIRASRMWLDFAVCRAGGFDDAGTIKPGRIATYSSPEGELSYEDPDVGHSVFGYYSIVQGLNDMAADSNHDGVATVQEAFSYARPRVVSRTNDAQHPLFIDRVGEGFTLVP